MLLPDQALKSMPEEEREGAERRVKQRTLGNIRLIAQLYKQDVVSEKILHACIQEMLGDGKSEPFEEDVEVRMRAPPPVLITVPCLIWLTIYFIMRITF